MKQVNNAVDLNKYKVWILDFDGTLYYQFPVRVMMGIWLTVYFFLHPLRIKEVFIIFEYRKLRENMFGAVLNDVNLSDMLIKKLSDKYNLETKDILNTVKSWLETKPCHFIHKWQRKKLIRAIQGYQKKGVQMVVYSDNPLSEKVKALSFTPDFSFDSDHELIKCLKPNTQGIDSIVKLLGEEKKKYLYIGDRDDRDGVCAKSAGIKYFDVNEFVKQL